jgi:hypothetical protein
MRIGSSFTQPIALPLPPERDNSVQRTPPRERESLRQVDESIEEIRRAAPRRRAFDAVEGSERVHRQGFSRARDFDELPANARIAIAAYTSTARLQVNAGVGELVGIDEIV